MSVRRLMSSAFCAVTLLCAARVPADDTSDSSPSVPLYRKFKVSIGYHYSRGNYGNPEATEIQYVPLVLTADVDRWRLQGTVPYLHISGPSAIVEGPNGPIQTTNGTSDGLGDVLTRLSYLLPMRRLLAAAYAELVWIPFVDLSALVKFPTGSRSKGLGTGEFDFGIDAELTWVVARLTPFASLGYRYLGSPPDTHLDDVLVASAGAQYRFLSSLSAGLLLDYRGAPTPATGQRLEIVPYTTWIVVPPWSVDAYVAAGLASGSPDVGVGVQIGYSW
jgi:hypothetical protein